MKSAKTLALGIFSIIFFSCNKNEISSRIEKFDQIASLNSTSERRVAFEMLTASDKASFWKYHINKKIPSLTNSQKKMVNEVYKYISANLYDNTTNDHIIFTTSVVPNWLKKAEEVFTKDKIFDLFYFMEGELKEVIKRTGSNASMRTELIDPKYDESAPDCICNIGSSYTCKKTTISAGFPSGVTVTTTYGSCSYSYNNAVCDYDSYGCGYLMAWACNGNQCTY
jgi:hypothetical protein